MIEVRQRSSEIELARLGFNWVRVCPAVRELDSILFQYRPNPHLVSKAVCRRYRLIDQFSGNRNVCRARRTHNYTPRLPVPEGQPESCLCATVFSAVDGPFEKLSWDEQRGYFSGKCEEQAITGSTIC